VSALESLGWLIRALGVVLPSSIATASAPVCIGGIPISVAEPARRHSGGVQLKFVRIGDLLDRVRGLSR